jgi:hypothetical protein
MKVKIELIGCDDTAAFEMEVNEEQFEFLTIVANRSQDASDYGCMPTMEVEHVK